MLRWNSQSQTSGHSIFAHSTNHRHCFAQRARDIAVDAVGCGWNHVVDYPEPSASSALQDAWSTLKAQGDEGSMKIIGVDPVQLCRLALRSCNMLLRVLL